MSGGVISEMGYVALQTTDVERSVAHARRILGLTETGRTDRTVTLASARGGRELVYADAPVDAVDRIGLVARDQAALDVIHRRILDRGLAILSLDSTGSGAGASSGIVFVGPGGFVFDVYLRDETRHDGRGGRGPDRYGHVNLHPTDLAGMLSFFTEVLEFRISDVIGDDFAYFLRCNAEHHGVALMKGNGWLHHHAWQTQSIADLGQLADRVHDFGEHLLMGPVRHGAGHNIAAYYVEPAGGVVELYTDMEMIYDDERPPIVWPRDDRAWATRWSVYDFTEFRSHGLFPAREIVR
jgi:catechol 2,3-dioxygenase